eukprot:TRINITY_DN17853_c0_g1_i1.p1 TRINITY_DN17853_c0_g1~~TRINITY_DN17853_c0_g1_i1.p1  ORF type:complete len:659 (+),score=207.89 TRINITY_DN17853_c0_g1_i1:94-2070(+)
MSSAKHRTPLKTSEPRRPGKTVEEAFDDYCVHDGRCVYVPRERLMPALHFMGLNPTYKQLADLVPIIDEDRRVFFGEFRACYEALKRTRLYGRDALIQAFKVFDPMDRGYMSVSNFVRAVSSSDDSLSDKETRDLINIADPLASGRIDYIHFAFILFPPSPKAAPAPSHDFSDLVRASPTPFKGSPRSASPDVTPAPSPVPFPDAAEELCSAAILKFEEELINEGETREQERARVLTDLRAIYQELQAPVFSGLDDVAAARVYLSDTQDQNKESVRKLQELKAAVFRGNQTVADAELRLNEHTAAIHATREEADAKFLHLPAAYDAEAYDNVRAHLMILWQCRHRIVSNSWSPFTDSGSAQSEFIRGCGGEDSVYRGSTPSPFFELEEMTQEDEVALMIGSYIHHGTSEAYSCPPLCLLPPQMLEEHAETAAARMLVVPCELDRLKCGVDDDSGEARACRACFFDGVNGRAFDVDSVLSWVDAASPAEAARVEARLRLCHRRGVWYNHESHTCKSPRTMAGDAYGRGLPHYVLVPRERVLERLDALSAKVKAAEEALRFLEAEFKEAKAVLDQQAKDAGDLEGNEDAERRALWTQFDSARAGIATREREAAEQAARQKASQEAAKEKEVPKPQPHAPKPIPKKQAPKGGGGCCCGPPE